MMNIVNWSSGQEVEFLLFWVCGVQPDSKRTYILSDGDGNPFHLHVWIDTLPQANRGQWPHLVKVDNSNYHRAEISISEWLSLYE